MLFLKDSNTCKALDKDYDPDIEKLQKNLTNLANEHNKYARLSLKWYNRSELGITNNDDIPDLANKTPSNSVLELWINDDTVFGRHIREELSDLCPDFFGYVTVRWTVDARNCHFEAFAYKSGERFFKTYTKINGENWGSWKQMC